jgi:hypothetical protein
MLSRVLLAAACVLLLSGAGPTPVSASDLRTGTATPDYSSPVEPSFPGLRSVGLRYDGVAGVLQITAHLRSPLASTDATSALRNTRLWIYIGTAYGDELFPYSCQWSLDGSAVFSANLGDSGATLDGTAANTIVLSEDRRTLTYVFGPDESLIQRDWICFDANLSAELGRRHDPATGTRGTLFDGFAPADGAVGALAAQDLASQFTYLHNEFVPRARARFLYPRGDCTPPAGSPIVRCRMSGRIPSIRGKPTLTVEGTRAFVMYNGEGLFKGNRGRLLRWENTLRARLRWDRCPASLGATDRPCAVATRWPSRYPRLADALLIAIDQRAAARGSR